MKKYIEYSANIYAIYLKYFAKEDIHIYSIDEGFMDVTNYLKMYKKNPIELAKTIIKDIYKTYGITATAGIGTNMYLAKIALDITAKHSATNIGYLDEEKYKMELWHHKPLTDFWQIGKGIERRLNKIGIFDMYDIAHTGQRKLYKEFGINAEYLIDHSWGKEPCTITDIKAYNPKTNSISNSQVLFEDYSYMKARLVLKEMVELGSLRLIEHQLVTSEIGIYIGYSSEYEEKRELSEETLNYLDIIFNRIEIGSKVKIIYYKNLKYDEIEGIVTNIDFIKKKIQINKNNNINISDISHIEV